MSLIRKLLQAAIGLSLPEGKGRPARLALPAPANALAVRQPRAELEKPRVIEVYGQPVNRNRAIQVARPEATPQLVQQQAPMVQPPQRRRRKTIVVTEKFIEWRS